MKNILDAILLGGRDIPPDEGHDCHYAPPDRESTTARPWSPNRTDTAISTVGVRTEIAPGEPMPDLPPGMMFFGVPEPGDQAWQNPVSGEGMPPMYEPGYAEIVTTHPTRLRANLGVANEEVCHYATGVLALDEEGYAVAVVGNDPGDATNYVGLPFIATQEHIDSEPRVGMEEGFCYFAGGYLNPLVCEFHHNSPFPWCRGIR